MASQAAANGGTPISSSTTTPAASIDAILSRHAKHLQPGQTITLKLVKGSTSKSTDPILARAASNKKRTATSLEFPRVAKFVETVQKPDFKGQFVGGRLFEEDVPEVKDESEDEGDGEEVVTKKKKRRWRKNEPPKQHWVMMEKPEFVEWANRQKKKKKKGGDAAGAGDDGGGADKLSSRYEALPEYNPSSYVMLTVGDSSALQAGANGSATSRPGDVLPPEHLTVTPLFGFHSFTQPAKMKAMSMHEAEQAINDQRNRMTRYMMHGRKGGAAGGIADVGQPVKIGMAKSRLLGKLASKARAGDPEDEDDDVMKDLAYRERKGGSAKARKELLASVGDAGVTVDDDGVLGGQNDAEFGGKRRFGRLSVPTTKDVDKDGEEDGGTKKSDKADAAGDDNRASAAGNDGMAMQDDFYQRDVGAEYEDLDYDANELFDDDDVDVGETEEIDAGGFAADVEDDLDEDDDEYDEEGIGKGIATLAGLKALMAKKDAGEDQQGGQKPGDVDNEGRKKTAYGREDDEKDFSTMSAATSDHSGDEKVGEPVDKTKDEAHLEGIEDDDDGNRLISLKAVQKDIWLHHGSIPLKRLMKIFKIKKKTSQERKNKFKEAIQELCTSKKDKIEGTILVLKPHYSKKM